MEPLRDAAVFTTKLCIVTLLVHDHQLSVPLVTVTNAAFNKITGFYPVNSSSGLITLSGVFWFIKDRHDPSFVLWYTFIIQQVTAEKERSCVIMSSMTAAHAPAIHRYRHEESENHCNRGVECLLLAEEEGYHNRELLTEAADAFLEAIRHYRQNTEAYVGMAYLLWILGDTPRALQYLEEGLRTQPNHPDIHRLIKQISGQGVSAPPAAGGANANVHYRAIREQIQTLQERVKTEDTRLIRPTINAHEIERMREALDEWEQRYHAVLSAIDGLDAFHVRVTLTCELSTLQDRILDYHSALSCAAELLALDDKIQTLHREVKQTEQDFLAQKPGMYEALLESYYDQCDSLADALDTLENKNIPVRVLDSHYQQLVDRVESLALEIGDEDA